MMKILQICKSLPFEIKGGIQTHVWELSLSLKAKGHMVSILSAGSMRHGEFREEIEGIEIIRIPYFPGRRITPFKHTLDEHCFNQAAKNWLSTRHASYDLIHTHGRSGLLLPREVSPEKRIMTFHGLAHREYDFNFRRNNRFSLDLWVHQSVNRGIEEEAYLKSGKVIAVSHELKNCLEEDFGKRLAGIDVLPNGILSERIDGSFKRARLVCFVGRFSQLKGIHLLPDILEQLPADVKMVCIGGGSEEAALKTKFEDKGLIHRCMFPGFLEKAEIYDWMLKSNCLIMPSLIETFGIVVLEAGMCSLPVVASSIPALEEIITHNKDGLIVDEHNAKAYVAAIERLMDDDELARIMGSRLQEKVLSTYNWAVITERLQRIYQQMVGEYGAEMVA